MLFSALLILPVIAIFLSIPVMIGVYVYRDASRRGMSAVLWTMIAVLVPTLIGFIIYLLVRENYSDLRCSQCGGRVEKTYVTCPHCGAKLRPSCPNCMAAVEPGWKVCPQCAQPLPELFETAAPVQGGDRGLKKIFAAIILIPLLLIGIGIFSFTRLSSGGASDGTSGFTTAPVSTFQENIGQQEFDDWLQSCHAPGNSFDKAYVLQYMRDDGGEMLIQYLIYAPGRLTENASVAHYYSSPVLGLDIEEVQHHPGEDVMALITYRGTQQMGLRVKDNGKSLSQDVTIVDFPLDVYN